MEQKYKDMLNQAKTTVVYAASVTGEKSKEIYNNSKINVKIFELNAQIDTLYKEIGKLVYEAEAGIEIDEIIIQDKILEIGQKKEEIRTRLQDKI